MQDREENLILSRKINSLLLVHTVPLNSPPWLFKLAKLFPLDLPLKGSTSTRVLPRPSSTTTILLLLLPLLPSSTLNMEAYNQCSNPDPFVWIRHFSGVQIRIGKKFGSESIKNALKL